MLCIEIIQTLYKWDYSVDFQNFLKYLVLVIFEV